MNRCVACGSTFDKAECSHRWKAKIPHTEEFTKTVGAELKRRGGLVPYSAKIHREVIAETRKEFDQRKADGWTDIMGPFMALSAL